jgi:hypothetical protein
MDYNKIVFNIRLRITEYAASLPLLKLWVQLKTFLCVLVYVAGVSSHSLPVHQKLDGRTHYTRLEEHADFNKRVTSSLTEKTFGDMALLFYGG